MASRNTIGILKALQMKILDQTEGSIIFSLH